MKRNLLFQITYNGSRYHGWQVQKNALTIQEVVQNAIETVFGVREDVIGCSRTDTGVHANAYYFSMKTQSTIPEEQIPLAINTFLPNDIVVLNCCEVPEDFHARYHVIAKEYIYKIWNSSYRNPFRQDMALHYPYKMDLEKMQVAGNQFIGSHDFKAFCSQGSDVEDTIRNIYKFDIKSKKEMVYIRVQGDGFLYNMVRIMVGTLLAVSQGKIHPIDIGRILESGNRQNAGKTAAACGLYLNRVFYDTD